MPRFGIACSVGRTEACSCAASHYRPRSFDLLFPNFRTVSARHSLLQRVLFRPRCFSCTGAWPDQGSRPWNRRTGRRAVRSYDASRQSKQDDVDPSGTSREVWDLFYEAAALMQQMGETDLLLPAAGFIESLVADLARNRVNYDSWVACNVIQVSTRLQALVSANPAGRHQYPTNGFCTSRRTGVHVCKNLSAGNGCTLASKPAGLRKQKVRRLIVDVRTARSGENASTGRSSGSKISSKTVILETCWGLPPWSPTLWRILSSHPDSSGSTCNPIPLAWIASFRLQRFNQCLGLGGDPSIHLRAAFSRLGTDHCAYCRVRS